METVDTQGRHHWSLTLLGMALVVMFAYYGESVLAVLFFAILLSFMLSPVVQALEYLHIPRATAALISMVVLLALLYGITIASYNQAIIFADNVPKYSQKIRSIVQPFQQDAEKLEKTGEAVSQPEDTNVVPVRQVQSWPEVLTHGAGTLTDILLAASFVPFLAYFLLTWHSHARSATVMLFPLHHRNTAFVTLGLIGKMLQSFIVGNLLIGLLISAVSVAIFGLLHVPFFYFIGFLSGFLSLVPRNFLFRSERNFVEAGGRKRGQHAVIIARRDRVVFKVVAARAANGQAEERRASGREHVVEPVVVPLRAILRRAVLGFQK